MNRQLNILLPVAMSFLGCRLDRSADVQINLPGSYSSYVESPTARVWETLDIKPAENAAQDFPVMQLLIIERKRKDTWVKDTQSRRLTGRYDPAARELLLVQRGKKYRVDLGKKWLTDQADTLRKGYSHP